jgi:D-lactate dehydrogenase
MFQASHPSNASPSCEDVRPINNETIRCAKDDSFVATLRTIVGRRHVLTKEAQTRRFRTGYRFGGGRVQAVPPPWSSSGGCCKNA